MKRPLATVGLAVLLTSLAAAGQPAGALAAFAGLCAAAFVLFIMLLFFRAGGERGRARLVTATVACAAICFALLYKVGYDAAVVGYARQYEDTDHMVSGHVRTVGDGWGEDTYSAIVEVRALDGEPIRPFKVLVTVIDLVAVGDDIQVSMRFGKMEDLSERMHARAVWLPATAGEYPHRSAAPDILDRARRLQYQMGENILEKLPQRLASITAAMTVGDKRFYTDEAKDAFRMAGLSHMMAVSGLHMSIVGGGAWALARRAFGGRRRAAAIAGMLAVVGYMLLCGFSASIVRSGVMLLIVMAAGLVRRKADVYTSLGFAALVLCLHSPYAAIDVGLLLSFSATLGALLGGEVNRRIRQKLAPRRWYAKAGMWLLEMIVLSLCTTVAIWPVLVWAEMGVALLTVPANILAVPLLGPIIVTGLVLALPVGLPWALLWRPAALINGVLQVWVERITTYCRDKHLYLTAGGAFVLVVTLVVYGLVALGVRQRRKQHFAVAMLAVALAVGLHNTLSRGTVEVLLAGKGASSVVLVQGREVVILYRGSGTDSAIERLLAVRGIEDVPLVVDIRQTAQGTQYERYGPQEVGIAADVLAGVEYPAPDWVQVVLRKQGDGFVVLVDVADMRLAVTTGKPDLTVYPDVDLTLPGAALPTVGAGMRVLTTAAVLPEEWEDRAIRLQSGDGIWIRPGVGYMVLEVEDG